MPKLTQLREGPLAVTPAAPLDTRDTWRVTLTADETADDSDKVFTVSADEEWQVLWIWVEYTSTAAVGDRQLVIQIQDEADDVVGEVRAGVVQAASLTYYYMFAAALADLTAERDTDYLMTPLPAGLVLPAGYDIRIYDNNAVDAQADDMIVQMGYAYRAV